MLPNYKVHLLNVFWNSCINDALDALSKMIRKEVKITDSYIKLELINNIPKLMSSSGISTTIVYTKIYDHLNFVVMTSSTLKHFLRMVDILLNKKVDYYQALDEENKPVIIELGNILNGYLISYLNMLFDIKFRYEEPEISVNPFRSIEDFGFGDLYKGKINVLTFKSDFKVEPENIEGKILLLANEKKIDAMIEAICKKVRMNW